MLDTKVLLGLGGVVILVVGIVLLALKTDIEADRLWRWSWIVVALVSLGFMAGDMFGLSRAPSFSLSRATGSVLYGLIPFGILSVYQLISYFLQTYGFQKLSIGMSCFLLSLPIIAIATTIFLSMDQRRP